MDVPRGFLLSFRYAIGWYCYSGIDGEIVLTKDVGGTLLVIFIAFLLGNMSRSAEIDRCEVVYYTIFDYFRGI